MLNKLILFAEECSYVDELYMAFYLLCIAFIVYLIGVVYEYVITPRNIYSEPERFDIAKKKDAVRNMMSGTGIEFN